MIQYHCILNPSGKSISTVEHPVATLCVDIRHNVRALAQPAHRFGDEGQMHSVVRQIDNPA